MYLTALDHWMYRSSDTGLYAYDAVCGIHGLPWRYNGESPRDLG
jgi:hypothetical protein